MVNAHHRSPWLIAGVGCALAYVVYLLPVGSEAPDRSPTGGAAPASETAGVSSGPRGWSSAKRAEQAAPASALAADDFAAPAPRLPDDPDDFDLARPLPAASPARAEAPPPSPSELHLIQHRRASVAP